MNKYSTSIGTAILMMMVGMSPIILSVIVTLASQNSDLETYTMPVAYLIGGLLCIFVANKGLNIQFRDYVHKPDIRLLILVIASAIFYEIFMTYTVYRETLAETTVLTTDDIFPIADLVFIAPLSEELIFRFAMLTILLIAPGNSRMKLSFSIGFVSILWVLPHFSGFTMRSNGYCICWNDYRNHLLVQQESIILYRVPCDYKFHHCDNCHFQRILLSKSVPALCQFGYVAVMDANAVYCFVL